MTDLAERIRDHYDSMVEPVTVDEILGTARIDAVPGSVRRWRPVRAVALVAAVVAVVGLAVVLLLDRDGGPRPVTTPTGTGEPVLGPGPTGGGDPDYQASASMVILPPSVSDFRGGSSDSPSNPLHYLGDQTVLSSLELMVGTSETRAELEAAGFSPDYTVTVDDKDPLMLVEVSDRDPVIAEATVDELIIRVRTELDALQAKVNAPQSDLLEIHVLTRSSPP